MTLQLMHIIWEWIFYIKLRYGVIANLNPYYFVLHFWSSSINYLSNNFLSLNNYIIFVIFYYFIFLLTLVFIYSFVFFFLHTCIKIRDIVRNTRVPKIVINLTISGGTRKKIGWAVKKIVIYKLSAKIVLHTKI
jgi:hypothetical protein